MQLRLREERRVRAATIEEIAQLVDLPRATWHRLETQGLYGWRLLEQIGQRLGVHPHDLVVYEGVPAPRQCPCWCHPYEEML